MHEHLQHLRTMIVAHQAAAFIRADMEALFVIAFLLARRRT